MELIQSIWEQIDNIVVAVLAILGGFRALAVLTPTKKDDEFFGKLIGFVQFIGGAKKK